MFGRIFIPLQEEELVVVPAAVVFKVGQLDMVDGTVRAAQRPARPQPGPGLGGARRPDRGRKGCASPSAFPLP